jgi:ABC-type branched-subunit amino acid transport system ATPase component/ABC-type branched-subunit amino acid transport system permease subunit
LSGYVLFLALGLGLGAVYALLGLGLVLEYRSSGVVNFAHGAIATVIAYEYTQLRATGDLVFPVVWLPHKVTLAPGGMGFAPAFAISIAYAAVLGLAIYGLVFRPLRHSPVLGKVVASVGLLLALESLVALQFGDSAQATPPILPSTPVTFLGAHVPQDHVWLAVVAVVATLVLWALYRYTRFGLATRASAENEKGATLLGYSSNRIAATNWVLATVLAGVAGILIAPITTLSPQDYSLLIIPALAVTLVGRFRSFAITAAAALALGMVQSLITKFQAQWTWFPKYGITQGLPFLVILIAMVIAGQALPGRGAIAESRSPKVARPSSPFVPAAALSVVAVVALLVLPSTFRNGLIVSMIAAIVCLSLVVLTGYVGQISLCQMTFAGVSGFAVSKLALEVGVGFPWVLVLAALCAVPMGLLLGIPALRVRGVQLAVITAAAAVAVSEFVFLNPDITGSYAAPKVPPPNLFGLNLDVRTTHAADYPRAAFGFLVLVVLVLTAIAVTNLRRNATGRRMLAVRANERAAAAIGVDVRTTKLLAFALSAVVAGLAGALLSYQQGQVSPLAFDVLVSVTFIAVAYIGGIARVSGAIIGALLVATGGLAAVALEQWINLGRYEVFLGGLALVIMAIAHPDGLATTLQAPAEAWRRRLARLHARLRPRATPVTAALEPAAGSPAARAEPAFAPRPAAGTPILAVEDLSVSFGGLRAVDGVSLHVPSGTIVGLIGPNGAGKSTLVDAVTGYLPEARGTVRFDGQRIERLRAHQRARRGLARTFQTLELFDDLSVRENVLVASERSRWWTPLFDLVRYRAGEMHRVDWALELLGLRDVAETFPPELSQGQRKLVSVARAIAAEPRLVLLDEPAAGLDSSESIELGDRLRRLPAHGIDVLLVDHDMSLVLNLCAELWVLDFGRVIAHGTPGEVRDNGAVIDAYLGEPEPAATAPLAAEAP